MVAHEYGREWMLSKPNMFSGAKTPRQPNLIVASSRIMSKDFVSARTRLKSSSIWLLSLILIHSVPNWITGVSAVALDAHRHAAYVRSDDMGITHCALQGHIEEEDVVLHLWLRMLQSSDGNVLIKGFGHLHSPAKAVPRGKGSPQLMQSAMVKHLSWSLFLRSPYTHHVYRLKASLHGRPLDSLGESYSVLSHVIDVWGTLELLPQDRRLMDFEVRADGFPWHCNLLTRPPFHPVSTHIKEHLPDPQQQPKTDLTAAIQQPNAADTTATAGAATAGSGDTLSSIQNVAVALAAGMANNQASRTHSQGAAASINKDATQLQTTTAAAQTDTDMAQATQISTLFAPVGADADGAAVVAAEAAEAAIAPGTEPNPARPIGQSGGDDQVSHLVLPSTSGVLFGTAKHLQEQPRLWGRPDITQQFEQPPLRRRLLSWLEGAWSTAGHVWNALHQSRSVDQWHVRRAGKQRLGAGSTSEEPRPVIQLMAACHGKHGADKSRRGSTTCNAAADMPGMTLRRQLRRSLNVDTSMWMARHHVRAVDVVPEHTVLPTFERMSADSARPRPVDAETEVWVVLSPYSHVTLDKYAILLAHHVLWHNPLGITRYMLYVDERLGAIIKEPWIQVLVSSGVLTLVQYIDMNQHETELFRSSHVDDYLMQVLIYNHAVLSLWGSNSLALIIDVDEYLVTARPMTAVQIQRRDAMCRDVIPYNMTCAPNASYKHLWLNTSPADVSAGTAPHPMSALTMISDTSNLKPNQDTKALLDPNASQDVHVHMMGSAPGFIQARAQPSCIRLVHLKDLFRWRTKMKLQGMPTEKTESWWWPANELMSHSQAQ